MLRLIARSFYVGNALYILLTELRMLSKFWRAAHGSKWQCNAHKTDEIYAVSAGFTMFVAITIPFFGALLSFFGGFAFAPTTYFVSSHWSIYPFFGCYKNLLQCFNRRGLCSFYILPIRLAI
jgi:hypothetical protein